MRTLVRTFLVVGAYLVVVAIVYWFLTEEDAGTLLLLGTAATLGMVAWYIVRRRGRGDPMHPEDDADASPQDAAGTPVGSFPFASAWPVVLVGATVVMALGVLFTVILLPMGAVLAAVAVVGLMRESRA